MTGSPEANVFINYQTKGLSNLQAGNTALAGTTQRVTDTQHAMSNLVSSLTMISNKVNEFGTRSVDTFASFDQSMANVKSIVAGTSDEVAKLDDLASQMGKDMPILAEEASAGFYELASAGKSANDIMALAPQITKTAISANADFATTAKLVTAVQDSWGLSNDKVNETTDILMNTVKSFKTTLPELSISMQYASTTASQLGISTEMTAGSIGMLRQAGLDASSAGTGLRMTMSKLAQATTTSNEKLAMFADSVVTSSDGSMDFQATLKNVQKQLSQYGPVERQAVLTEAFGNRTAGATAILLKNVDALGNQAEKLREAGAVADAYDEQMKGAGNQLKILQGRQEEQERMMGEKLLPTQIKINEAKIKFLEVLNKLPGPMGEIIVGGGMIASNMMQMIGPLAMATNAVIGLTGAQWSLNIAMLANPVGLVVLAIIALIAIVAGAIIMIEKGATWVKLIGVYILWVLGPIGWLILIILLLTGKLDFMKGVMKDVGEFFKNIWDQIVDNAKRKVQKFVEMFNLAKKAKEWGKQMVYKFVRGIKEQIDKSKDVVKDAVKKISGFFGGSPPEFGPLKDAMDKGGPAFVQKYVENMGLAMGAGSTVNYYNLDARSNNNFGEGIGGADFVDDMYNRLIERLSELGE